MNYEKKMLSTGTEVALRGLTWEEFWQIEEVNLDRSINVEKQGVEGQDTGAELALVRFKAVRAYREERLSLCLANWSEEKSRLSMAEIAECEKIILEMGRYQVAEGNSAPSVATTAADAPTTAAAAV